jgi:molybdate transport system ATP-binding protein
VLRANVEVTVGDRHVELELTVDDGEIVALLGPNGAGKTSTLRAVAGLLPIDAGRIELDGVVVDEPATGTFVPTEHRPIGYVFQDYLLFPRMSALDNVAFGLRARGRRKDEARAEARTWLGRFGLADRADAKTRSLSGGEAQRVALARALATDPRLLLLDEPLAALDASYRLQVRAELRRHLATFPGGRLLVTHDPVDAIVLADRLVIIEDGRATQSGTPAEVTARPLTRYVAELVGMNLLDGERDGHGSVRVSTGATIAVADDPPAGDLAVAIRPRAVAVFVDEPHGSPRNVWQLTVADLEANGDRVRATLTGAVPLVAELTTAAVADLGLEPGDQVWAAVKAVDVDTYPR